MSNIQRSYTAIKQSQAAEFENNAISVFETADIKQGAKIFAMATLKEIDRAGIFNRIENHVDQKTTATVENPLDFIAKAIGAVGDIWLYLIMFIVVVIAAIIAVPMILGNSRDQSAYGQPAYEQQ